MYEVFGAFEFMFHASRTDAIPEEVWTRWSSAVAWWLTFPGVQAWWQARPIPFTESFTAFMESLLKDNPTDAEQTQRYQEQPDRCRTNPAIPGVYCSRKIPNLGCQPVSQTGESPAAIGRKRTFKIN
jgi:hypothetical protein